MAIPALLGIGALIKSLFAAFILWIQKYSSVALRLVGVGLLLAGVALLVNLTLTELKGILQSIAMSSPPSFQNGYGLIAHMIPSNINQCLTIMITAQLSGMLFQWLFYTLNTKAKVLTE